MSQSHYSHSEILFKLRQYFQHKNFNNETQQKVIEILINDGTRDIFVCMPTGSGKSLCYQLPILFRPASQLVLVVSPLLALIDDQVSYLNRIGLRAETLNSTTPSQARVKIVKDIYKQTRIPFDPDVANSIPGTEVDGANKYMNYQDIEIDDSPPPTPPLRSGPSKKLVGRKLGSGSNRDAFATMMAGSHHKSCELKFKSANGSSTSHSIPREVPSWTPVKFIYVTPEFLAKSHWFKAIIHRLVKKHAVAYVVIDEAHCVSQWGHNFRPDYLKLRELIEALSKDHSTILKGDCPCHGNCFVPCVALTATSPPQVVTDVGQVLGLRTERLTVLKVPCFRSNLYYEVRFKDHLETDPSRPDGPTRNGNKIKTRDGTSLDPCFEDLLAFITRMEGAYGAGAGKMRRHNVTGGTDERVRKSPKFLSASSLLASNNAMFRSKKGQIVEETISSRSTLPSDKPRSKKGLKHPVSTEEDSHRKKRVLKVASTETEPGECPLSPPQYDNDNIDNRCRKNPSKVVSGIIYCRTRDEATNLAIQLNDVGKSALAYHAGLKDRERSSVQRAWMTNWAAIIVATVSFGMGIDKEDVRYIIHWNMPKSLAHYYQESGRAGRDGRPSHCVLYYALKDRTVLSYFTERDNGRTFNNVSLDRAQALAMAEAHRASFEAMVAYCETASCRHGRISRFFGDPDPMCRNRCDYCSDPLNARRRVRQYRDACERKASKNTTTTTSAASYSHPATDLYGGGKNGLDHCTDDGGSGSYDGQRDGDRSDIRYGSDEPSHQLSELIKSEFRKRKRANATVASPSLPKKQRPSQTVGGGTGRIPDLQDSVKRYLRSKLETGLAALHTRFLTKYPHLPDGRDDDRSMRLIASQDGVVALAGAIEATVLRGTKMTNVYKSTLLRHINVINRISPEEACNVPQPNLPPRKDMISRFHNFIVRELSIDLPSLPVSVKADGVEILVTLPALELPRSAHEPRPHPASTLSRKTTSGVRVPSKLNVVAPPLPPEDPVLPPLPPDESRDLPLPAQRITGQAFSIPNDDIPVVRPVTTATDEEVPAFTTHKQPIHTDLETPQKHISITCGDLSRTDLAPPHDPTILKISPDTCPDPIDDRGSDEGPRNPLTPNASDGGRAPCILTLPNRSVKPDVASLLDGLFSELSSSSPSPGSAISARSTASLPATQSNGALSRDPRLMSKEARLVGPRNLSVGDGTLCGTASDHTQGGGGGSKDENSYKKRISRIVVACLNPHFLNGDIPNKRLFKDIAKQLTENLIDQDFKDDESIKARVQDAIRGNVNFNMD